MALNTSRCNRLTPLRFKELMGTAHTGVQGHLVPYKGKKQN